MDSKFQTLLSQENEDDPRNMMQNITNSENFLSTLEENSQTNIKHFLSPRIIVQQERQLKQDKISKESLQNVTETIQNIESNLRNINRKVDSL